ncbi:hypothetical protein [Sulfurimonas sp. HSL3-2]|uniref:hypothetical protein n=1 Tax=Hydrocurvibacter mobilis TaxID=3131936 RepID=UPI0031F7938E
MTFEQQWIEYDFNPFILFDSSGKIVSLNAEAQFLLGSSNTATIFEIATLHASQNFGFKTTFMDLEFGRYKFFGITVGYENEDQLGIRLYQVPSYHFSKPKIDSGEIVNVYTLIDLCISTNSISSKATFLKDLDPSIPDVRLNTNLFVKLLNRIYSVCLDSDEITTKLFFRVGEHIKFDNKKYSLFTIMISSSNIDLSKSSSIDQLAEQNSVSVEIKDNYVSVNIPLITD